MMPFLYPTSRTPLPILILSNRTSIEEIIEYDDDENNIRFGHSSLPPTDLTHLINENRETTSSTSNSIDNHDQFSVNLNVEGFKPDDLSISIRNDRIIVRGKHFVQTANQTSHPITTNSIIVDDDDGEADFLLKEFKRTFYIPPNVDTSKARAKFHHQYQILTIEMPHKNLSQIGTNQNRIRTIDVFLTILTIILMNRTLRITSDDHNIFVST